MKNSIEVIYMQNVIELCKRLCLHDVDDLQAEQPKDWLIPTGVTTIVGDYVHFAFEEVVIEVAFKIEGVDERAYVLA
jgi:GDP-D-mannose dehydratase